MTAMADHSNATPGSPEKNGDPAAAEGPERREHWLDRLRARLFAKPPGRVSEELAEAIDAAAAGGDLPPHEQAMLRRILALRELRVDDVMVPRADIISVPKAIHLGDLLRTFDSAAHTRLIVHGETLDEPVGMVHIKDLLGHMVREAIRKSGGETHDISAPSKLDPNAVDFKRALGDTQLVRPVLFVPPSMAAGALLEKMQASRLHVALVVDEYGGTDGLVTLKDILEQVVGGIDDEHEEPDTDGIVRTADGSFIADGRVMIEDVVEAIGPEFEPGEDAEDVETLGGLISTMLGRVPVRGEIVPGVGPFEFEVLDADPRRVKKVRIAAKRPAPARPRKRDRSGGDHEPTPGQADPA